MIDYNQKYFILECGSNEVPSPYISCNKSHYLTYRDPLSLKSNIFVESPAAVDDNIPLINAMYTQNTPMVSKEIKDLLNFFDIYKLTALSCIYTHSNNHEYQYWIIMLNNVIFAYDLEKSDIIDIKEDGRVSVINIRLDNNKLNPIPLHKRQMFEIPGMRGKYIIHQSLALPLIELNATGLHLVPLLEWDMGYDV